MRSRTMAALGMAALIGTAVQVVAQPATSFGEGTHLVGSDIQPGLYRTEGEVTYFERLSGLSGELDDIIANEARPSSPTLVEIKADDVAFRSEGPGVWTLLDETYTPMTTTAFGPGYWLVGRDILPGLYRTVGEVTYFERLSGLGGELSDILANDVFPSGPVVVDIMGDDFAFHAKGSATWELIEAYEPKSMTVFGDGMWIVGKDILPGTYRTEDDVSYYARLSGFSHNLADIISNAAAQKGGSVVEILSTDVGFETSGGATWELASSIPTSVMTASWGQVKLSQDAQRP